MTDLAQEFDLDPENGDEVSAAATAYEEGYWERIESAVQEEALKYV